MKLILQTVLFNAVLIFFSYEISAQESTRRYDKLYTMSGIGMSFPIGETTDFYGPKISTSLGINLGLGNGQLFLYPKVSLHVYSFDGLESDDEFTHTAQNARSSTYLLNIALGYRHTSGKLALYGFAGGGGGIILTPTVVVTDDNDQVRFNNKSNGMAIIETGVGTEYNIGGVSIFIETSVQRGFNKIESRSFMSVPVVVGIKPNLSKLFN